MNRRMLVILPAAFFVCTSSTGHTQQPGELGKVVDVIVRRDQLIALDGRSDRRSSARLSFGEKVLWSGARGEVGVVLTSRNVFAIYAESDDPESDDSESDDAESAYIAFEWQQLPLAFTEATKESALLGGRLGLIVTDRRVIGFNGQFVEFRLNTREKVISSEVGYNVGVVATTQRLLGLSYDEKPSDDRVVDFVARRIGTNEQILDVTAGAHSATVTTTDRVHVYMGPGNWTYRLLK